MMLGFHLGPVEFERELWLLLLPLAWGLTIWMGRSSLSGLGTATRRLALGVRLVVVLLLVGAVAEPNWRRVSKDVSVTAVVDTSRSVPLRLQQLVGEYLRGASVQAKRNDLLGQITVARGAYVVTLPGRPNAMGDAQPIGSREGTNLAEGIRLALAVAAEGAANRIVLASDGNETAGDLLSAAESARAAGVPIDVLPLKYSYDQEVIVERVITPGTARKGQTINVRVMLNATAPAVGRLSLMANGEPIDLDPDSDSLGRVVELVEGLNPLDVPINLPFTGPQEFVATFEPMEDEAGVVADSLVENNQGRSITFVSGEGKVLMLASDRDETDSLVKALEESRLAVEVRLASEAPHTKVEFAGYDAIVLVNTPAWDFSNEQQENLKSYIHDLSGGLVMVGGPDSFGAGGWIGSPLADALPIKMDPPQKRQMPLGALVMMMHSCEIPNGNYWGKETALAAVDALSRLDLAGVVEYDFTKGDIWVHPLSQVGNKSAVKRAINSLSFGDAQSFEGMFQMTVTALEQSNAGQKHAIVISDGDPTPPTAATLQRYVAAGVTVSTVAVFPHNFGPTSNDLQVMRDIAQRTGGSYYEITTNNQLNTLPQIFIKEAQTVRRTLIWEGDAFAPTRDDPLSEPMKGITGAMPAITGYIVAADRAGLSTVSLRGQENDPVLAHWNYGLGKVVTFTSDATGRWAASWVSWDQYKKFWEQHVRWAMRPTGSADMRIVTIEDDGVTRVMVEAVTPEGRPLNFVRFNARVSGPEGFASRELEFRQVDSGRYEATFPSELPGSYVANINYQAPTGEDRVEEGSVQAAVTKPFADEFRALRDNSALLRQVALVTGGRVLSPEPDAANLWDRAGLTMPVARKAIWLAVSLLGIGLFLLDVAVRRVRIDLAAIAASVPGLFKRSKGAAGVQMSSLQAAREKARAQMDAAAEQIASAPGAGQRASAAPVPVSVSDRGTSKAKFEASDEEIAAGAQGSVLESDRLGTEPARKKPRDGSGAAPGGDADEGMSRLLKAKKRALDGTDKAGDGGESSNDPKNE